jgi:sugar/nucleoside kinase (ribokinase family)
MVAGAVACGRLSRPNPAKADASMSDILVNMIAAVGDDDFGSSLIQGLKNGGVNTDGVKVRENMSSGT